MKNRVLCQSLSREEILRAISRNQNPLSSQLFLASEACDFDVSEQSETNDIEMPECKPVELRAPTIPNNIEAIFEKTLERLLELGDTEGVARYREVAKEIYNPSIYEVSCEAKPPANEHDAELRNRNYLLN